VTTKIYMNEDNIEWTARFTDAEEKNIFSILKESKLQRFDLSMLDNALQMVEFNDYSVISMNELLVSVVIEIGGNIEKRRYDFIKNAGGWGVVREFKGHPLNISISINESQTTASGFLTLDVQGNGTGAQTANIQIFANTKTAS
jgi:hypothetical protein